jgi:hypothetical protein
MSQLQTEQTYNFGFSSSNQFEFTKWVIQRLNIGTSPLRLEGQGYFNFLKSLVRKHRWETWSSIQKAEMESGNPDPAIISDVCRELSHYFIFFRSRHITFLVDDYSNQRIPPHLQKKLNQTISFAKQGTPIFKVSSEYYGVDLEGIQEGREVVEINIGAHYISSLDKEEAKFLADIVNIRLKKAKYVSDIRTILGSTSYDEGNMPRAIYEEAKGSGKHFYYYGINCIHWLCSGDVALALDLIKKIYERGSVKSSTREMVSPKKQHEAIQDFSNEEIRRIKYIVPHGEKMYEIIIFLGCIARAFVTAKIGKRKEDKRDEPMCVTHLDIRLPVIQELQGEDKGLAEIYGLLTSRAILFTLQTSRSRIEGATERLQLRKIYLPSFRAPLKRDTPIKIDSVDELKSLLSNPRIFAERELKKSDIDMEQLEFALQQTAVKPKD